MKLKLSASPVSEKSAVVAIITRGTLYVVHTAGLSAPVISTNRLDAVGQKKAR